MKLKRMSPAGCMHGSRFYALRYWWRALWMTLLAAASLRSGVMFTDSSFNLSDYSIITWKSDPSIMISVGQTQTGGNPGQALQILYNLPATSGNSMVGLPRPSFTYDPATQGAIQGVDFSVDKYATYTGCSSCPFDTTNTARLLILQNGTYYMAVVPLPGRAGTFLTATASGLRASDFGQFDFKTGTLNTAVNPDFNSGVMQFGVAVRYLFQFDMFAQAEARLDNLVINVHSSGALPSVSNVFDQAAATSNLTAGMPIQVVGTGFGVSATDSATVTIGSEAAPVLTFINSTNIIVQVPVDVPTGANTLTVSYKGQTSTAFKINIVSIAPEIEPFQSQGGSSFYDVNGNPITTAHPAIPGTEVYCLAIGLGTTNPAQVTNTSATASAPTTQQVQVMVGNKMVQPIYAGLFVGGTPGYYQVSFTVPADAAMGNVQVTLSVGGQTSNAQTLVVAPPIPVINAIVNGATFGSGAAAANSFVSLFGLNFGTTDTKSNIFPATSFNGLSVRVNGTAIPLYFVVGSGGQINIVLPSELAASGNATVEVMTAEGTSAPFQLALAADSVGIFRIADPSNPKRMNGAVLFSNTAWKVMPLSMAAALGLPSCASVTTASICGKPAKVGDQIQIYLTGLGKATPNGDPNGKVLATGSLAPTDGSVLYKTLETPVVKIGGIQATVEFSGIAPGNAGQYQINVAVPSGVKPGDDVTLEITMSDGSTDTVTIAITS